MRYLGRDAVAGAARPSDLIDGLERALLDGLDPSADPDRLAVPTISGQLLVMPSASADAVGVKVAGVVPGNPLRGLARVTGMYVLLDGATLLPRAVLDGAALTAVRTAAVSGLAIRHLGPSRMDRAVIIGTGPQARSHLHMLRQAAHAGEYVIVGRSAGAAEPLVRECRAGGMAARAGALPRDLPDADLVVCCTTAAAPLFTAGQIGGDCLVVAIGSHEPHVREFGDDVLAGATIVVETRAAACREAGEIVQALARRAIDRADLIDIAELVRGAGRRSGRRVFKSVGMAWEDLIVARTLTESGTADWEYS